MWSVAYTLCMLFCLWASSLCHTLLTVGPCVVNTGKATFDCSRRNLTSVPQQIWPNVTELDLSENCLNLAHAKALKLLWHFDHLIKLNLSGNYLPLLEKQHFSRLSSLEILDLSGCRLAAVEAGAVLSFPRLQKLFLGNNNLQTPMSAVHRGHGWINIVDLSSNFQPSDRSKEVVSIEARVYEQERHSGDVLSMVTHSHFQRKLLTETLMAINGSHTDNSTNDGGGKRSSDSWKYLVAALVTAISFSVIIAVGVKCKLISRYLASYRHSRLSEADGASQCDPASFEVGFSSRPHSDTGNGDMMEEDDDGFIEDNYIQASERERAAREAEHWQEEQEDKDDEELEEFSIA